MYLLLKQPRLYSINYLFLFFKLFSIHFKICFISFTLLVLTKLFICIYNITKHCNCKLYYIRYMRYSLLF